MNNELDTHCHRGAAGHDGPDRTARRSYPTSARSPVAPTAGTSWRRPGSTTPSAGVCAVSEDGPDASLRTGMASSWWSRAIDRRARAQARVRVSRAARCSSTNRPPKPSGRHEGGLPPDDEWQVGGSGAARATGVACAGATMRWRTRTPMFGLPIWQHQSIGNLLADMGTKITAAAPGQAADTYDDTGSANLEAGMAKPSPPKSARR